MSSESENIVKEVKIENCSVVLADVAGTITSINFVKETLFPFVLKQAETFLQSKWEDEVIKGIVKDLQEKEEPLELAAVVELVKNLTEQDNESKHLKVLQGLIYTEGYQNGELKAHIFDDVPANFEKWATSKKIAIYSTGSIDAQKELFKNTILGDLSGHISNYFDQSIGSKLEADSYKEIVKTLKVEPVNVLFLTDNVNEAKAAKAANLQTLLVKRAGNGDFDQESVKDFTIVESFNEITLESAKRKNDDVTSVEEPPAKISKPDETETIESEKTTTATTTEEKKIEEIASDVKKTDEESPMEVVAEEETKTEKEKKEEVVVKVTETKEEAEKIVEVMETDGKKCEKEKDKEEVESEKKADEEVKNGEEESGEKKVEESEKENTSDMANGLENGKTEELEKVAVEEKTEIEAENKDDETTTTVNNDVKTKKVEETAEKTVSAVEV